MLQASNVRIPCDLGFNGRFNPGSTLLINGLFPYGSDGFSVSLNCGKRQPGFPEPDTALLINPRMSQCCVVRNSKINGNWGVEERVGSFVFAPGHYFCLSVVAENYEFKLSVNGSPLGDYKYRVPLNRISGLVIEGNVTINEITTGGMAATRQPILNRNRQRRNNFGSGQKLLSHIANPIVPSTIQIPGNLKERMQFIIRGRPTPGADRFSFNWLRGNGDYAFHFNPRMSEKAVVRNTMQNNMWGPEERAISHFPFHPSTDFTLTVIAQTTYFEVRFNGNQILTYNYRLYPLNSITKLSIEGNVTVTYVTINE